MQSFRDMFLCTCVYLHVCMWCTREFVGVWVCFVRVLACVYDLTCICTYCLCMRVIVHTHTVVYVRSIISKTSIYTYMYMHSEVLRRASIQLRGGQVNSTLKLANGGRYQESFVLDIV